MSVEAVFGIIIRLAISEESGLITVVVVSIVLKS
jgi:hypothetical protein